jgi:hypothetical protein
VKVEMGVEVGGLALLVGEIGREGIGVESMKLDHAVYNSRMATPLN